MSFVFCLMFGVFIFFGSPFCAADSGSPLEIDKALSDFYSRDLSMVEGGSGLVRMELPLKNYQNDTLVDQQVFAYKVGRGGRRLSIEIPTGPYYMDLNGEYFGVALDGEMQCQGGLASSGWSISRLRGDVMGDRVALVLYEWSCGSLGCSYSLVFGDELLSNRCSGSQ